MTIPDHELSEAPTNNSRIHFPALKWATAFVLTLVLALAALSWLAWANLREWEWSRTNQQDVSKRVAEDRLKINQHQAKLLNELRLQTFNQMLPPDDQRRLLPSLLARLDDDTQKTVQSLRLRSLMGAGPQESETLQPQRPYRGLAR